MKRAADIGLAAINVEGGLISPEKLAEIAATTPDAKAAAEYHCPKGTSLRDEITRYFRIGQAHWQLWARIDNPTVTQTAAFAKALLEEAFGFETLKGPAEHSVDGHRYRIAWEAKGVRVPIVIAAPIGNEGGKPVEAFTKALPEFGDGGGEGLAKRSPVALLQDWLNASPESLWGLVFAGDRIRLMRDNASFTRPAYIEADLGAIFRDEMFADFTAIWLLIHATRFGAEGAPAGDSPLERWREAGQRAGTAARERLRSSVKDTLLALGQGFLDANPDLRTKLDDQTISMQAWFEQLLRVVYRLIFLAVAEDRDLLLSPGMSPAVRSLYLEGYGFAHMRDRSVRRSAHDHHFDAWEGAKIVFRALERGEKLLGLPALGGIFARGLTPDLDDTKLPNRAFMAAIFKLSWLMDDNRRIRINWRDMATEELGSVYEGLLELVPVRTDHGRTFAFAGGAEAKGNARKISGSYYTPDSLVQTLLDSALDPVLDRAEAEGGGDAILALNVIDPACGSGHFLLGAARRMATRVAQLRDNDAPDYPAAMRDVARNCIHGVDRNPMAVELAKVALWIETVEPGKPLGFLDANIQCGDSLLGIFDLKALEEGIPDDAYKPLTGDDKTTAKYFAQRNKAEKSGQGLLDLAQGGSSMPPAKLAADMDDLRHLPEDTVEQVEAKRKRFAAWTNNPKRWATKVACDLYIAAFLLPKKDGIPANPNSVTIPTTGHVRTRLGGGNLYGPLEAAAIDAAGFARAFHWPLAFPEVMIARGGFDAVLGNPPWERIKLQEQEFFAITAPEIAVAPSAAARDELIQELAASAPGSPARILYDHFELTKRLAEATSAFSRVEGKSGGRFSLTARGDINTYALFAELFSVLVNEGGRAGLIVKAGLLTDYTNRFFIAHIVDNGRIRRVVGFNNLHKIFPAVHPDTPFVLLTLGKGKDVPILSFELLDISDLQNVERQFKLLPAEMAIFNPNTRAIPSFRTRSDASLTAKIYQRVPVLLREQNGRLAGDWSVKLRTMFHKSNASRAGHLLAAADLSNRDKAEWLPIHEGEYGSQYDHRYATYDGQSVRAVTAAEHSDPDFEPSFELVANRNEYNSILESWADIRAPCWLAFRRVSNSGNDRTSICAILPRMPCTYGWIIVTGCSSEEQALLSANFNSLVFDYLLRNNLSQPSIPQSTFQQMPTLPPLAYSQSDIGFIVPRVLELSFTSRSVLPFATDLGSRELPFIWDEERRAHLRADLDAWYALAYGLSRDELRYVLDPKNVMGADYPSETFRVLQKSEIAKYNEYRTSRLVLAAYDRLVSEGARPRAEGYR